MPREATMLDPEPIPHDDPAPRMGSVLLRVLWMGALPFVLLCLFLKADQDAWTFGAYDLALVALVIAAVVARGVDALHFGGTTARGEPATRAHVVGYSIRVVLFAAIAWVVAQSIAL